MKIYFAGSIRGGRDDREFYGEIIELLKGYGEVLTEHIGDKTLSALGEDGLTDKDIYERDMAWLEAADAVVAEVTTPSLGVGYEIAKAEVNKPVLCLYREQEGRRLSAMIGGSRVRVERYQNIQDVEKIVKDFLASVY
ncbi:MAG: nucleoside 2-deoxyribosyltransferase [bacterium]|nr:nucleoside 2-deoxyribosyltransferase [bacterium]MDZ4231453.1 nucleoside 2-deoxyribosyltransferase [Patescibacteria group bacterium]